MKMNFIIWTCISILPNVNVSDLIVDMKIFVSSAGKIIEWVDPGIFFIAEPKIKTRNYDAKAKFYRAFNSIMAKSAVVPLRVYGSLIKAKCLSILLYACHLSVRETTSLELHISCAIIKVHHYLFIYFYIIGFYIKSSEILENCKLTFELPTFCTYYYYETVFL